MTEGAVPVHSSSKEDDIGDELAAWIGGADDDEAAAVARDDADEVNFLEPNHEGPALKGKDKKGNVKKKEKKEKKRKEEGKQKAPRSKAAQQQQSHKKVEKELMPNKPRRARSAFSIFSANRRQRLREDSGLKLSAAELSKELGRSWKELTEEERRPYKEEAEEEKKQYEDDMEVYRQTDEFKEAARLGLEGKAANTTKAAAAKRPRAEKEKEDQQRLEEELAQKLKVREVTQVGRLAADPYLENFDLNKIPRLSIRTMVKKHMDRLEAMRVCAGQKLTLPLLKRLEGVLKRKLQKLEAQLERQRAEGRVLEEDDVDDEDVQITQITYLPADSPTYKNRLHVSQNLNSPRNEPPAKKQKRHNAPHTPLSLPPPLVRKRHRNVDEPTSDTAEPTEFVLDVAPARNPSQ